jgi:hypothetical protein
VKETVTLAHRSLLVYGFGITYTGSRAEDRQQRAQSSTFRAEDFSFFLSIPFDTELPERRRQSLIH